MPPPDPILFPNLNTVDLTHTPLAPKIEQSPFRDAPRRSPPKPPKKSES